MTITLKDIQPYQKLAKQRQKAWDLPWLPIINAGVLSILGWKMALALDPEKVHFQRDAYTATIILTLALICSVWSLVRYVSK